MFRHGFLSVIVNQQDDLERIEALLREVAAVTIAAQDVERANVGISTSADVQFDVDDGAAESVAEAIVVELLAKGVLRRSS